MCLYLDNDLPSHVIPSQLEHIDSESQHLTESHLTIYDIEDAHSGSTERFSLPSWRETCLPGHESLLLDDDGTQGGSSGNLDCLSRDTLGDDIVDREYESSEDDSEEILGRLQESEQFAQEDEARNAIGDIRCSCSEFSLSIALVKYTVCVTRQPSIHCRS